MFKALGYEYYMARRLGAGHARTGAFIAVAGVACALAIMLLTWGIARGFNIGIKERLSGFEPQIKISAPYSYMTGKSDEFVVLSPELRKIISTEIPSAKPSIAFRQPAIIKTDDNFETVVVCGFDANHDYTFSRDNIVAGILPDFNSPAGDTTIVLSQRVVDKLGLKLNQKVTACYFIKDAIRSRRYRLAGIYNSGFGDYDATVAYGSINALQRLNRVDSLTGTSIELNNLDLTLDSLPFSAKRLQQALIDNARNNGSGEVEVVDNICNTGAVYLNWLDLIETNVVVIFALMCLVAALTLVSSLFIIVLDRISLVGLLRAMGATRKQVRRIFILIAMRLVILGVVIGDFVALGFGMLQKNFGLVSLDPEMYYIDKVPFSFDIPAIFLINTGVLFLSWAVLIIPAKVAADTSPARTIRYE